GDALSLGGAFEELDAEGGFSVGRDTFESPNLYAFNEDQNIRIPDEIAVDIGRNPQAGEIVASHYVFFDPIWGTGQIGYVEFDAPILGVATSTRTLAASDYLLNTNVTYLNPTLRGLEPRDAVWIDPDNPFRLRVNWLASTPGDYVRVFTQRSPVAGMAPNDAHALLTERARPSKR
ncbi:MAG: hypothetical protein AAFY59_12200, partial [Pseudomonadota bacterium]